MSSHEETSIDVTQLLVAWREGDPQAFNALIPRVRRELHRLAAHYMAGERPGHILQATALVNEAYLRLVDWKGVQWADHAHFFAMAANVMRRVLVDYARNRDRAKRGGDAIQVSLAEAANRAAAEQTDVLALNDALERLEQIDPRKCRIVEMRFFAGLSLEETAEALNVSVGTVRRDWSLVRAWLSRELSAKGEG